ncbi:MAG: hypothetical protein Q8M98_11170 [Candidatus Cloacimonadaceae bacterium]|nr:hypothetical protein [Candidatus Cloacimonadaceae bacterium]MDP3115313.1 hypothetical protein [Candidatus Cloacimonadaceae bacterium]
MYEPPREYQPPQTSFDRTSVCEAPVIGVFEWIVIQVLMMIPLVNIIVLIVWAVDNSGNPTRGNFAKAYLIIIAFQIVMIAIFLGTMAGTILNFVNELGLQ